MERHYPLKSKWILSRETLASARNGLCFQSLLKEFEARVGHHTYPASSIIRGAVTWRKADSELTRKKQVLVIGFGKDHCTEVAYDAAYQVGLEIAKHGAILITGGLGGVMEAASRGAKDGGGFVIGIIPQDDKEMSNTYCDAVIATGIGFARDFITVYSADAIIVIGGGAGTLIELSAAYQRKTPIVAVKGTGGVADRFVDEYIDDREMEKILGEDSPEKAVSKAISLTNLE